MPGDSPPEITTIRTMEEFASVSGVSRPTLSKYFNNPQSVRKTTRQRIERAARAYDYRPNIFAVNLNRKSTKNIGVVVPYLADPFFAEIARNIERRCIDAGYSPVLYSAHGRRALETGALDSLRMLKPAGALIAPLGDASELDALRSFAEKVPTVLFDSDPGIGAAYVGTDHYQSIQLMVEYLCRTGEQPCFFEMPPVNPNATTHRLAYIRAMERLDLEPQVVSTQEAGWDFEGLGLKHGQRLIAGRAFPSDTVLCSNDRIAVGLLAAAYEKGLRVGRGPGCAMRIAGHDDHPWARFTCPPLTTIAQNYAEIAERSVATLFSMLDADGGAPPPDPIRLEGRLIMRASA